MSIKITKKDVKWSYAALIFSNGVNVILLPFVLSLLSTGELGLWYTFTAVGALATLLDFGLSTTITRNVALIWSGVSKLTFEGYEISERAQDAEPNYKLFVQLLTALHVIYFLMSLAILVILSTIGSVYIISVAQGTMSISSFLPAWIIYLTSVVINIYFNYWNPVLKGMGAISESQKTTVISKTIQLIISLLGLYLGFGLMSIAVACLIATFSMRICARMFFRNYGENRKKIHIIPLYKSNANEVLAIIEKIWPNTYKEGVITLSSYLTSQASILFSSAFLSLEASSAVGLTQQLFTFIIPIGNALYNTYIPLFSLNRIQNKKDELKKHFYLSSGIAIYTSIIGGVAAVICVPFMLELIKSNSKLISTAPALLMLLYLSLNNNHTLCGSFIATGNRVPMYKAYAVTSVIFCAMQVLLLKYTSLGVYALILPILICQLCYNNWKWPFEVSKELGIKLPKLLKNQLIQPYIFVATQMKSRRTVKWG